MSDKILSIIVPSYNMEKYLPKCLGSLVVAPELMERLEVLVVNDGSKDRTSEIAHEFATKWLETFRVIDKPNGNYGSCINAALPVATGTYVKVLDADDWFSTSAFETYLKRMIDLSGQDLLPDLILNDFDKVDENGKSVESISCGTFPPLEVSSLEKISIDEIDHMWMHMVAYLTDKVRRLGYRQTEGISYTDNEWIYAPMGTVSTVYRIPVRLYNYLVNRDGQTMAYGTFFRNLWMLMRTTQAMACAYAEKVGIFTAESRGYLMERLANRIKVIYMMCLLGKGSDENLKALVEFDRYIKERVPDFYQKADGITASRLRFHYVREWRRGYTRATVKFRTFDFLCRIRGVFSH